MARNRMIKPDFWADEKISKLSVRARLLYIGIWNFADDEGLIRANPAYIRSCIFPYDEDISIVEIKRLLAELEPFLLTYKINEQEYALVKNFHKHQSINKRQPSKLPAPDPKNCTKYRDYIYSIHRNDVCPVCGREFTCEFDTAHTSNPSIDHIKPLSKGGTHHPSNLRVICCSCDSSKKDKYNYGNTTVILQEQEGAKEKEKVKVKVKENVCVKEKEKEKKENTHKKVPFDPYVSDFGAKFKAVYREVVGISPYLSSKHVSKIYELIQDINDFWVILPKVLAQIKSETFRFKDGTTFKPNAAWLLTDDNFYKIANKSDDSSSSKNDKPNENEAFYAEKNKEWELREKRERGEIP